MHRWQPAANAARLKRAETSRNRSDSERRSFRHPHAYIVRDQFDTGDEPNPIGIPGGAYEIPLVVQDRQFNADGTFLYPTSDIEGVAWIGEYFGDTMLVNGKVWPFLEVEPRMYRFRILNGCNARILSLNIGAWGTQTRSDRDEMRDLQARPKLRPAQPPKQRPSLRNRSKSGFFGPLHGRLPRHVLLRSRRNKVTPPGLRHCLPQGVWLGAPPHRAPKPQPQFRAPGWVDSSLDGWFMVPLHFPREGHASRAGRDHDLSRGTGCGSRSRSRNRAEGAEPQPPLSQPPYAVLLRAREDRPYAARGRGVVARDDGTPGIQSLPDPQVGLQLDLCVSVALRSRGRCGL